MFFFLKKFFHKRKKKIFSSINQIDTFLLARPEYLNEFKFAKLFGSELNCAPLRFTKNELLFLIISLHSNTPIIIRMILDHRKLARQFSRINLPSLIIRHFFFF